MIKILAILHHVLMRHEKNLHYKPTLKSRLFCYFLGGGGGGGFLNLGKPFCLGFFTMNKSAKNTNAITVINNTNSIIFVFF